MCRSRRNNEYIGQFVDGVHLSIANAVKRGRRGRNANGAAEVNGGTNDFISREELRRI